MVEAYVTERSAAFVPARTLHVGAVYVEPGERRQGLARQLLERAFEWARTRSCLEVELNVVARSGAEDLYRSLGFEPIRLQMVRSL